MRERGKYEGLSHDHQKIHRQQHGTGVGGQKY